MRFTRRHALAGFGALAAARGAAQTIEDPGALQTDPERYLRPGAILRIPPGEYSSLYLSTRGEPDAPIRIEALDPANPPVIRGLYYLTRCAWLTLDGFVFEDAEGHHINADDGGRLGSSEGLSFRNLTFRSCGTDPLKLAGIDRFDVTSCRFEDWKGSGVAMVGCHGGRVEGCTFRNAGPDFAAHGVQIKGGSKNIEVKNCFFDGYAHRWINIGGATLRIVFRPKDAPFEAAETLIEGNRFVGGNAPVVWSTCDSGVVRNNTIYLPFQWICRIVQENDDGTPPCRNGVFERNLIVYDGQRVDELVQKRLATDAHTFAFRENAWFDTTGDRYPRYRPWARYLTPSLDDLPVEDTGSIHGEDPQLIDPGEATMRIGSARLTERLSGVRIGA